MPFPLIPIAIGSTFGAAIGLYLRKPSKPKGMTPERQRIYEAALNSLKDASKLRTLADAFNKEGLTEQGNLLLKRAALRELSPQEKQANQAKFKNALKLTNPAEVLKIAGEFDEKGCTGAAYNLRNYAKGLK